MSNLESILEKQGRSINWLAQKSGLSRQTIWNVIKKHTNPMPKTQTKIAEALDLPLNVIFFDKDFNVSIRCSSKPSSSPLSEPREE